MATLLRRDLRLKTCMPLTCVLVMTCELFVAALVWDIHVAATL